ncbi:hypothetical protein Pst134EB_001802 [Puccinia striiformis f. sp. tritici]|uniref:Uncharacterized protein n=1 Tax=Puccinia striiformis f. sp. tritici PST-78 TaxID=1165861 RepID=A0A0L0URV7_9BASI|nr:hypothetical protein Pst134EB_001802 [Puccinia striiformis f. sp. tritici]KNE89710.1 hypothetical protein PSTG_16820 [Puccinia striiformis f. sp. tritici PST-78]
MSTKPNTPAVICPETQMADGTPLHSPSRLAAINFDFLLFVQDLLSVDFPHCKFAEVSPPWAAISPVRTLAALPINLQAFTWDDFQLKAFAHLRQSHGRLNEVFAAAHDSHQLVWFASISGSEKYNEKVKFPIKAHPDFLDFASTAYLMYPNKVLFKLVMLQPWGPGQGRVQMFPPPITLAVMSGTLGKRRGPPVGLQTGARPRVWAHSTSGYHSLALEAAAQSLVTNKHTPVTV